MITQRNEQNPTQIPTMEHQLINQVRWETACGFKGMKY